MPTLETYFTEQELEPFQSNFRKFIRLTALSEDPLQQKWVSDECDVEQTLLSIADMFHGTEDMVGKRKHKGVDFNVINEVKLDMTELLLTNDDETKTRLLRKRHLPLYHLIVEPVIDLMNKFNHTETLNIVDDVMKQLADMIYSTDYYGTYEDALIASTQVKQLIQQHEEQQKLEKNKRKRKRKSIEVEIIDELIDEIVE